MAPRTPRLIDDVADAANAAEGTVAPRAARAEQCAEELQEVLQRHRINPQAADCQSAAWGGFRASAVKEGVDAEVRCDCRGCLRRW